jgi:hypothetical protein
MDRNKDGYGSLYTICAGIEAYITAQGFRHLLEMRTDRREIKSLHKCVLRHYGSKYYLIYVWLRGADYRKDLVVYWWLRDGTWLRGVREPGWIYQKALLFRGSEETVLGPTDTFKISFQSID